MKTNEYMEQTEQYVLHTYNRFPLVIDHGEQEQTPTPWYNLL